MVAPKGMKPSMSFLLFSEERTLTLHHSLSLEDLRQSRTAHNPQKPFLTPSSRKKTQHTSFRSHDTMRNNWKTGHMGLWKLDPLPPILQAVKDRFPPGSEWLWKRCNEVLYPSQPYSMDMKLTDRARALGLALYNPGWALRPSGSLVSSESVDKLRVILARAPQIPKDGDWEDEIDGVVRFETWHPEWDVWYDWDKTCYDTVFHALIEVVEQHGVGDEGWASAGWEVYDRVSIPFLSTVDANRSYLCRMRSASRAFNTIIGWGSDGLIAPNIGLTHQRPWATS